MEYLGQTIFYFIRVSKGNDFKSEPVLEKDEWSFYYLFGLILLYSLVNFDKIGLKYLGVNQSSLGIYSLYFFSAFIITGKVYDFLSAIFFSDIVTRKVG